LHLKPLTPTEVTSERKPVAGLIAPTTIPEIVPSAFPHNAPNTSSLLKLRLSATYTKAALILTALNI